MEKLKQAFRKNPSKNNHPKTPPSPPSPPSNAQQAPVVKQQPPPEPQPQHHPPQPQPYHHIRLGQGGAVCHKAYRRGDPDPSLTCIGTTGTIDTVGVFFEMSDDRCFIAHIEAYTTQDSSPGEALYSVNFKSAAELRSMIIARLNWYFGGPPTARMRDTLVMTCARLSGQEARCSEVAAKAVREWLGAGVSDGGRVAAAGTGFQVGWSAAGRFVFEQESGEQWGAVEYPLKEGQWCFVVAEQEIDPCDEAW
jgi:hypothetical protein